MYVSRFDISRAVSLPAILKRDMGRPFCTYDISDADRSYRMSSPSVRPADFLFTEPIVLLLAIYIAIAYATLYAFFAAYPMVFQQRSGFSEGEGGLAFLGIGVGNMIGLSLAPIQNRLYWRAMDRNEGRTVPEA